MYKLYVHTNLLNNKKYVGITSKNNLNDRFMNGNGYKNNPRFWKDIQKYGWESGFKHEVLLEELSVEEACKKEIEYISLFNTTNPKFGYNRSAGGDIRPGYNVIFYRLNLNDCNDYKLYSRLYDASIENGLPINYIAEKLSSEEYVSDAMEALFDDTKSDYLFIKKSDCAYLLRLCRMILEELGLDSGENIIRKDIVAINKLSISLKEVNNKIKESRKYSERYLRIRKIERDINNLKMFNTEDLLFLLGVERFKYNKNFVFYKRLANKRPEYYISRYNKNNNVMYPEKFVEKIKKISELTRYL